jgi:hypothetical protein
VTAYAIGCLASISIDCGYPKETLALLGGYQCQEAARRTTTTTQAWLAAVEAEGAALLGDEKRSLGALHRADRLLGQADGEPAPIWMGFFDPARLTAYQGDCRMHLKRADAEQTLRAAAESLAPVYSKRRSAVLADLAAHYARAGDLEPAADAVARSYELAMETDSAIYSARAGAVRRHLERHARRHPAVTALGERLRPLRVSCMSERHIVAMGGGGFSFGLDDEWRRLDHYAVDLTGAAKPRMAVLGCWHVEGGTTMANGGHGPARWDSSISSRSWRRETASSRSRPVAQSQPSSRQRAVNPSVSRTRAAW